MKCDNYEDRDGSYPVESIDSPFASWSLCHGWQYIDMQAAV